MPPIHVGERWEVDPTELSLRPYSGTPEDLAAIAQVRNDTLRAITLPEDYHDFTPAELSAFYEQGDYTLVGNAWLVWHSADPVAAAVVYPMGAFHDRPPGNFHLYVVPRMSGHGLGSRLLDHLEQAAIARGHPVLETTIAREDERSMRFLQARGFAVVGHSVHLSRDGMEALPDVQVPAGFSIASLSELGEGPELYREHANRLGAYDPNYSLITSESLAGQAARDAWDPAGVLFLFDQQRRVVGAIRASRTGSGRGYLNEIRIEPASRGKGLGTALVAAALHYLRDAGVDRVDLDTPGENTAAHGLALRAGFTDTRHWLHFLKRLRRETC